MALFTKHIHFHFNCSNNSKLEEILKLTLENNLNIKTIMTKQEKFDAALTRLDATTNDIAADLVLLKSQIEAGTVSDESLAKLDVNVATLEALGASTENPVPEPAEYLFLIFNN